MITVDQQDKDAIAALADRLRGLATTLETAPFDAESEMPSSSLLAWVATELVNVAKKIDRLYRTVAKKEEIAAKDDEKLALFRTAAEGPQA